MNAQTFFFWWDVPKKIIWDPFWWLVLSLVVFALPILNVWWWLIVPVILAAAAEQYYLWWVQWDFWVAKKRWVVLEIKPPRESLTPFKAMEDIFSVVWTIYDEPTWREYWCEGEMDNNCEWASFELVSIEGKVCFYVRCLAGHASIIESVFYSHYPEIEIKQVPDYTKNVPQNIPNEEWNIYGTEFVLHKHVSYPIKTYSKFFEPQGERISAEEKRIDPVVSLLEALSRLGPGEQFWFQMVLFPVSNKEFPFRDMAKKLVDKIAKRPVKKELTFLDALIGTVIDFFTAFWSGLRTEKGESTSYLAETKTESSEKEMLLTPGEREIITEIEEKAKKSTFKAVLRGVYVAKRSAWNNSNRKTFESYTHHFTTLNLNRFTFHNKTRTKVHFIMRKKRLHLRQMKMFQNYILRYPPLYPEWGYRDGAILNAEEVATMYHFPTKISALVAPTTASVEAKKGGPPPNLPVEQ